MKKILFLLLFIPLVSFGQKRTVTDLGVETIIYGQVAKYVYDGNPFNDNNKRLTFFFKRDNISFSVSKSDLHPDELLLPPAVPKIEYRTGGEFAGYAGDDLKLKFTTYEFIFDDDRSTYFKLDSNSVKNITSFDNELFLKFKKHKKVAVREKYYETFVNDGEHYWKGKTYPIENNVLTIEGNVYKMIPIRYSGYTKYLFPSQLEYEYPYEPEQRDYIIHLTGFTAAINKYMGVEAPTMKNKNIYKVANGLANVNPFNLDKYIDKFILDAKTNHNIDLSYVNNRDKLILFKELEGETIAAAYKMNDDDNVLVLVDPENWYDANQSKRWYIIYHELGHDILNLEHGECGPMMNETASGNYSWDRLEKDKNTMFETYKSKL